ncbi:hypothetical protein AB0O01_29055 [Streptomyces sp. NPDC093252]|uniref:hypothetical protein n=1 Tax=Streptomyces sp. NPDC093252 TaxID=3154980 RepID=UPI00343C914E
MAGLLDGDAVLSAVDGAGVDDPALGVEDERAANRRFDSGVRRRLPGSFRVRGPARLRPGVRGRVALEKGKKGNHPSHLIGTFRSHIIPLRSKIEGVKAHGEAHSWAPENASERPRKNSRTSNIRTHDRK